MEKGCLLLRPRTWPQEQKMFRPPKFWAIGSQVLSQLFHVTGILSLFNSFSLNFRECLASKVCVSFLYFYIPNTMSSAALGSRWMPSACVSDMLCELMSNLFRERLYFSSVPSHPKSSLTSLVLYDSGVILKCSVRVTVTVYNLLWTRISQMGGCLSTCEHFCTVHVCWNIYWY